MEPREYQGHSRMGIAHNDPNPLAQMANGVPTAGDDHHKSGRGERFFGAEDGRSAPGVEPFVRRVPGGGGRLHSWSIAHAPRGQIPFSGDLALPGIREAGGGWR